MTSTRSTTGTSVYRELRDDIMFGRLPPGGRLKLEALRSRYTAGTNTIREALARLSAEGFVEAEDQKGFCVRETSPTNLSEISDMRALIEIDGVTRSIDSGDLEWEGRVVAAMHKLRGVETLMMSDEADHLTDWTNYDYEFHRALISGCASQLQLRMHRALYDQFRRYVFVEVRSHGFRGKQLRREHDRIGEAALDRDSGACACALRAHLRFYIQRQNERVATEPLHTAS